MSTFKYGELEKDFISKADVTMARLVDRIGHIERAVEPDLFSALVSSIISQQISTKAADTVKERLDKLTGGVSSESLAGMTAEDIKSCGMSLRKAAYIHGVASSAVSGDIDFNSLHKMDDKDVIMTLSSLRGVGVWTAEMMLIFSLQRPDVMSYLDLGIRRGIMRAYGLKELSRSDFEVYRKRFSPYGSIASLYFWRLAGMENWESFIDN
jgi:3-methyladenine DNA glycosylase/8-oxoguanine DNA glycosylase